MDSVWTSMPFVKNTEDAGANAGVAKKGDSSGSPPLQNGPPEGMSSIHFGRVRRHRARPLLGRCLVAVGLRAEHLPLARDDLSEAPKKTTRCHSDSSNRAPDCLSVQAFVVARLTVQIGIPCGM